MAAPEVCRFRQSGCFRHRGAWLRSAGKGQAWPVYRPAMIFVGVVERVRPVTTCARQKLYHSVAFPAHMWTPGTPAARPTTGGKEPGCRLWQLGDRRPWTASGTGWPGPATSLPEVPATTGSRKYPGRPRHSCRHLPLIPRLLFHSSPQHPQVPPSTSETPDTHAPILTPVAISHGPQPTIHDLLRTPIYSTSHPATLPAERPPQQHQIPAHVWH